MTSDRVSEGVAVRRQRRTPTKQVSSSSVKAFRSKNFSIPSQPCKSDGFRQSAIVTESVVQQLVTFSSTKSCGKKTGGVQGSGGLRKCGSGLSLTANIPATCRAG
jgi:hypothetical protein